MISNRLFGAFACALAVLSEFVHSALLTFGIEIPMPPRRDGTSDGLKSSKLNELANKLREARFA